MNGEARTRNGEPFVTRSDLERVCSAGHDAAVMRALSWRFLGTVPYRDALSLQLRLREELRDGSRQDLLLLLEHPFVITLGRSAQRENVLAPEEELAAAGISVHRVGRGGDVTLHGPGQLVGYPLRRLHSRNVRAHVLGVIEALRSYLERDFSLRTEWQRDNPGLWTEGGKIAAVGIDARGGVAMHGFALNLSIDLERFGLIVPCGLKRPVTSVARETGRAPTSEEAAPRVAEEIAVALGYEGCCLAEVL